MVDRCLRVFAEVFTKPAYSLPPANLIAGNNIFQVRQHGAIAPHYDLCSWVVFAQILSHSLCFEDILLDKGNTHMGVAFLEFAHKSSPVGKVQHGCGNGGYIFCQEIKRKGEEVCPRRMYVLFTSNLVVEQLHLHTQTFSIFVLYAVRSEYGGK